MESKIEILVGLSEEKRRFLDDFNEEVKFISYTKKDGTASSEPCSPVQLPCRDKEGNTVWVYVPVRFYNPAHAEARVEFMRSKAKDQAEWVKQRKIEEQRNDQRQTYRR